MTRREVLLARDAYANGMVRGSVCEFVGQINGGMSGLLRAAERAFPLPTVTRPRVVAVEDVIGTQRLRLVDGCVEFSRPGEGWRPLITPAELAAIRSLDAEPTETEEEA